MVDFVFNLLVYILNTIIFLFSKALSLVISVLPISPFLNVETMAMNGEGIGEYLPYLCWLLPIKHIITILGAWLGAMLVYYCYSVVMRWIKVID